MTPWGRRGGTPAECGGGSLLALCLAILGLIGVVLTTLVLLGLGAVHRARGAADLASLAGAQALVGGEAACPAAERVATRNQARVVNCVVQGERVLVTAAVKVGWRMPGLPTELAARAAAAPVAEAPR